MSKAVLVMDMPSSCDECPLVRMIGNNFICTPRENSKKVFSVYYHVKNEKKPDWCPLKPMPEKKVLSGDVADIQKMGKELLDIGYNACIDELLKGEEG